MKPLSRTMKDCLRYLLEHDADELWVQIDVGGYYTHNTLNALKRRGLVEILHRRTEFDPNHRPDLTMKEAIKNSYTCVYNDPWVKLTDNDT